MGTDLTTRARGAIPGLVLLIMTAACATEPQHNAADIMFAQMSIEYARQGAQVATPAATRATDPRIRAVATELRDQWHTESRTMTGWLADWDAPATADPDAGAHAGHGDLHSLREADIAELTAATGADFDRTAVGLLLGHLHNTVEVARMETAQGSHPPAKGLADRMTAMRQTQIQSLLKLAG